MSRRTLATVVAIPLMVGLWLTAVLVPVPYVTYHPGVTVDMLAERSGHERIQVVGHRSYHDDDAGELRMTTVSRTRPEDDISLVAAFEAWASDDDAVQPRAAVYGEDVTNEEEEQESTQAMVSSQDIAVVAALRALDIEPKPQVRVADVQDGSAADGTLEQGDRVLAVDGAPVKRPRQVVRAVRENGDNPVRLRIRRLDDDQPRTVTVTPRMVEGKPTLGVVVQQAFFSFDVRIDTTLADGTDIGGPSAGTMFALTIYDALTPGAITGGRRIAGTGTIDEKGVVGGIGGIQQKIAASREAGSELFLVPAPNCEDAEDAPNGDMRMARVKTLEDAIDAVEAFAEDPDADLPRCPGWED